MPGRNAIKKTTMKSSFPIKNTLLTGLMTLCLFNFFSCIPARQFDDMKGRYNKCDAENSRIKADNLALETSNNELRISIADHKKKIDQLMNDTADMGIKSRRQSDLYMKLENSYEKLIKNNEKLNESSTSENRKLLNTLENTQADLIKKEDELKKMESMLNLKEANLNDLSGKLKDREARMQELESILNKKDSTVKALKNIVSAALLGFENNGLTVTQKNGKVYVSLEEQLLFASGSTVVDKKGETAIKQLATVLEKNTDINVLIEGHTDNVPIKGGAIKDNWDLSVQRATAVVRIINTNSKVSPVRLTAAGRGEYMPVVEGSSPEVRKKNRRIEIILTPKLDELFQVLENN